MNPKKLSKEKAKRMILGAMPEMEEYIHLIKWKDVKDYLYAGMPRIIPNELAQKVSRLLQEAQQT